MGEHSISKDPDCVEASGVSYCNPKHEDILVEKFTPHDDYNLDTRQHDIALIRLSRSVELSRLNFNIKTVCLPVNKSQEIEHFDDSSAKLSTTGWGRSGDGKRSDALKYAEISYLTNEECTNRFLDIKKRFTLVKSNVEETEMCASSSNRVDL